MRSFRQWLFEDLGYSLIPPNIPKTQTGVIGNELKTDSGKASRAANGNAKNKITELPVPRHSKYQQGFGDLGMEIVGNTTFGDDK
jgi:hypothetical protein